MGSKNVVVSNVMSRIVPINSVEFCQNVWISRHLNVFFPCLEFFQFCLLARILLRSSSIHSIGDSGGFFDISLNLFE